MVAIDHQLSLQLPIRQWSVLQFADSPSARFVEQHQAGAVKNEPIALIVEQKDFLPGFDDGTQDACDSLRTDVRNNRQQEAGDACQDQTSEN